MGTLENSEDPDEMQHNDAFHLGLHCLLRLKQPSGTEIHHNGIARRLKKLRTSNGDYWIKQ